MDYLSKEEADVIGEISNISIGSSATALNKMLRQPVIITTPNVSLIRRHEILDDYEDSCIVVKVQYTKGLFGKNLMALKDDDAKVKVDNNVKICKQDWDSFETSWEFKKHPLI